MHVGASPVVDVHRLRPGQEVMLNEALTVVEAGGYENVGEIVTVKEMLGRHRASSWAGATRNASCGSRAR